MENQIISINLVPNMSTPAVVRVSQYDVGRPLVFKVYDGTSPADLTGVTAVIEGTKKSGLGFSESGTVTDNTVTLNTTLAMTQEDGAIPAEIRFSKTGEDVGTANFILAVEKSPHLEGTTDGTQETMQNLETRLQGQIDALDSRIDAIEGDQSIIDDIDALDARVTALEQGGGGLTDGAKQALLACFNNVAWINTDGSDYYNALYNALYPPANLVSISCVYTQSGTVYDTDNLDSLKDDLVVTAHYDDSSTSVVTTYTLNGTLSAGTSTITVIYSGQTTTFNVTVTEKPRAWYTGVPLTLGTIESGTINTTTGADVEDGTKSRSGFLDIEGAYVFQSRNANTKAATGNNARFFFYDADYDFISSKSFSSSNSAFTIANVPNDTKYVRVSALNDYLGDEATTPSEFVAYIRPVVSATAGDVAVTSDTAGYNISTTTGRQGTSGSTRSSQLIPIYGATAISMTKSDSSTINYASVAFYDKEENYMGFIPNYTLAGWSNIPFRNCAYMRRYQFGTNAIPFTVSITV